MSKYVRYFWYKCRCGHEAMTGCVDDGVTPMYLRCKTIGGCEKYTAQSQFHIRKELWPDLPVTFEWFTPDHETLKTMSADMREHIEAGGLTLRRIGQTESLFK